MSENKPLGHTKMSGVVSIEEMSMKETRSELSEICWVISNIIEAFFFWKRLPGGSKEPGLGNEYKLTNLTTWEKHYVQRIASPNIDDLSEAKTHDT